MDVLISAKVAAIFLLILGNAFFVASEIALTSARRSRIAQLASEGDSSARIVQMLHANPERFYSVTQIGITLMSLALGAIGIATFTEVIDPPVVRGLAHLSFLGAEFNRSGWPTPRRRCSPSWSCRRCTSSAANSHRRSTHSTNRKHSASRWRG